MSVYQLFAICAIVVWIASCVKYRKSKKKITKIAKRVNSFSNDVKSVVEEQKRQSEEQIRQAKEQGKLAAEQERQAAVLAKHEEQIMKLDMRMALAESEIAFNKEQRDRLFELLDIEELERNSSIPGSSTWQKHQRKVIALENQIHTTQKRIDKAQMEKAICRKKLSA